MPLFYVVLGIAFGFVLSRSGAADYDFIQQMLLLRSLRLYGVLATAVLITAVGLWAIRRRDRLLTGQPMRIEKKTLNRGTIVGAVLFGVGWSIAGMCPGPIFVNVGEGKLYAIASLLGALTGAGIFGAIYESLQKPFGLPALTRQYEPLRSSIANGAGATIAPQPTTSGGIQRPSLAPREC